MKKTLIFLLVLFLSCTDDEGNPCVYQPTLTTEDVTNITDTSATLNGIIAIVSQNCEVAPGEMQGFVYSTNPSPTNDDNVEVVYGTDISATIDNLIPNTTYYTRVFITNSLGEFYGNEVEFTTNEEITEITNCDGNPVPTIVYGSQEWTVENACHITYRDGTSIPEVTDNNEWLSLTTGAWRYYDNNDSTGPRLYNWYAVMGIYDEASLNNPSLRKEFAPEGWHIPSDTEWTTLENYLIANGYNYDGTTTGNKIAKAIASTTGWNSSIEAGTAGNDQSSNNSSGFNAFPEGGRINSGVVYPEGANALFWSSTEHSVLLGWGRYLHYNYSYLGRTSYNRTNGHSVRLVRD